MSGRIDVHHHLIPDFYRRALGDAGIREAGGRQPPNWDVEGALELMELNDFTATMRTERPDRFGFFATLPMPDILASVAEAERGLDERGADGVVLLANNRGVYLGAGGPDRCSVRWKTAERSSSSIPPSSRALRLTGSSLSRQTSCSTPPAPPTCSCATGW